MADSIYWIQWGTILRAPLAGRGTIETLYGPPGTWNSARGLAMDPAAGRIYWTTLGDDAIRYGADAPGGTPQILYDSTQGVNSPVGVAIDSAARRIYWSNAGDNTIRRAPLAGGGPTVPLYDSAHGVSGPTGMAIDPAAGRIYWVDSAIATIRGAPLAGVAGGGTVLTLYGGSAQGVSGPVGVAIDAAAGRIYWSNLADWTIRGARLAGAGAVEPPLYDSAHVTAPGGLAIDPNPAAPERLEVGRTERFTIGRWLSDLFSRPSGPPGRIYWPNGNVRRGGENVTVSDNMIQGAPIAGHGTVDTLYGGSAQQSVQQPSAVAVLRGPVGTGPPTISWGLVVDLDEGPFRGLDFGGAYSAPVGQRIRCSTGTWAPDLPGCLLYRAPHSFAYQWMLNGTDIGGATQVQYTASAPGSYSCRVTASNQAGSATQTSAAVAIS